MNTTLNPDIQSTAANYFKEYFHKPNSENINLRIPVDMKHRLDTISKVHEVKVSDLIRMGVKEWLDVIEGKILKST